MQHLQYCDPFSVGFDRMFDRINQMHQTAQKAANYPPYNILKVSDSEYAIEMAVAGFTMDQLEIVYEDGQLRVTGRVPQQEVEQTYIHRGLASRPFARTFTLADTVEVREASIDNGILNIKLENIIPEHKKPKRIEIGHKTPTQQELLLEESQVLTKE